MPLVELLTAAFYGVLLEWANILLFRTYHYSDDFWVAIGPVRAEVFVRSSTPYVDVVVRVCDVQPDGRVLNVVEGVRRVEAEPGTDVAVEVEVGSTAHVFLPGHRVRVHVAASCFPRLDVTQEAGKHTVHVGGRAAAALVLPLVEESSR